MVTHNLPRYPTAFVGRLTELAELAKRLNDSDCHLLTLVGPGGIGKTRLASEVAAHFADQFADGAYFVPLQPLNSPDFLVSAVADSMGFQFHPAEEAKQQLLEYLRDKALLLVLDNFEHLADGAGLLSDILDAAPQVFVLATSRERLNLIEEWVFDVRELSFPTNEAETNIESYDAVRLFVQHSRRMRADFALTSLQKPIVIRICRLVGGMPLGIEIAAAWIRALSCEQIASELERSLDILETSARNVEPRHRTMRVVFEPTWKRLSQNERTVFKKLSVFRGGFTREAAEYVAGASLHALSNLVDRSLLQVDASGRYDVHELLRQYAGERLNENSGGNGATQDLHLTYFSDLLHRLEDKLKGSQQTIALDEIESELDNIRSSWRWAIKRCNDLAIRKSLQSLILFYIMRGRRQEGDEAFSLLLQCLGAAENTLMVQVLLAQASFKISREHSSFTELARHGLGMWRDLGVPVGAGLSIGYLTVRLLQIWSYDELVPLCQKALNQAQESGNLWEAAWFLYTLGDFLRSENNPEAMLFLQQSADSFRLLGNRWALTFPLGGLEQIFADLRDFDQSRQLNQEGLVICREIGDREGIIWRCGRLAQIAYAQRDTASAKYYLRELTQLALELRLDARIHEFSAWLIVDLLVEAGARERAVELLTSLQTDLAKQADSTHYKPVAQEFKENYEQHLIALEPQLSRDAFVAARQRGETSSLRLEMSELMNNFLISNEAQSQTDEFVLNASSTLVDSGMTEILSERELQILLLVAQGFSNREIARELIFSLGTVKWYVHQVYRKLGVGSRTQAIARARELSLLL